MKRSKKISTETIHANPWWSYQHDTYEKTNGEIGDYYYGVAPGNAMVIPVLPDGRIAMVLQHRYLMDRQSIEFPCGGRKNGEIPEETAKKELLEETGFITDELTKVGSFQALNGFVDDECHIFVASIEEQTKQSLDDTEEIEVLFRRPDEIDAMVKRNDIWDGQTLAAWALVHNRFLHPPDEEEATV